MPAMPNPQDILSIPSSGVPSVAAQQYTEMPLKPDASDSLKSRFSELYANSRGEAGTQAGAENLAAYGDKTTKNLPLEPQNGNQETQVAIAPVASGNYLPLELMAVQTQTRLQNTSLVGTKASLSTSVGKEARIENQINNPVDAVGGKSQILSLGLGLELGSVSEAVGKNGKINAATLTGQTGVLDKGDSRGQQMLPFSYNAGQEVKSLNSTAIDSQLGFNQGKENASVEKLSSLDATVLPIKIPQTQQFDASTRKGLAASVNPKVKSSISPNLLQGIEPLSEHKTIEIKANSKEAAKDLPQAMQNQVLRQPVLQNIESLNVAYKDINKSINIAVDMAVSNAEEADSNSLRTLLAIPKLTTGISSTVISGAPAVSVLSTSISSPTWSQEFNQQIVILSQKGIQQANIQLNPQHLGPMDVRISIGNEQQVNVSFNTQHGMVRDAIDVAMPRLREMFEQQGLTLGDVNVSTSSGQNPGENQHQRNVLSSADATRNSLAGDDDEEHMPLVLSTQSANIVDYFA